MLNRLSLLALTTFSATLGWVALGSSAAVAVDSVEIAPDPLPNVEAIIFAETVENFTQGHSRNWNRLHRSIRDTNHERWINGFNNAEAALGENTWKSDMTHRHRYEDGTTKGWDKTVGVSLGKGGSLTVGFGDNYLIGNGDSASDVWIYEIGRQVEKTYVEIGDDQGNWYGLGIANRTDRNYSSGVGINIDALFDENHNLYQAGLASDTLFSFIRVTDDAQQGGHGGFKSGADIDAIAALSFIKHDQASVAGVPEPGIVMALGMVGVSALLRRKQHNPSA